MSTEFEVIPQIKRSGNTVTGKMFKYLASNPMEMGLVETVIYTLKAFWLPLSMQSVGIRGEELRKVALWAIGVLESQINTIKRICGLENISQLVLITPMVGQETAAVVSPTVAYQQPNSNASSVAVLAQQEELCQHKASGVEDNYDDFFDDDSDVIPAGAIEGDAGFRV
ncbi:hypothetical protein H6G81_06185 [Scytonema hofmannii FACHB-248]|uniref:Uncharacterized protein n=1 Tax=Scytonema hofmannii FACHB-248 TaxID=1842502 RepID=A0ABR8GMZ1_9CYAN|nr:MULTISPECIES: hypothetical protein [Nostocales]MBD2604123.1 hypothetical protein [Scytonema hofmannii FACHB-248]